MDSWFLTVNNVEYRDGGPNGASQRTYKDGPWGPLPENLARILGPGPATPRDLLDALEDLGQWVAPPPDTFVRLDVHGIPDGDQNVWDRGPVPFQVGDVIKVRWPDGSTTDEKVVKDFKYTEWGIPISTRGLDGYLPLSKVEVSLTSIYVVTFQAARANREKFINEARVTFEEEVDKLAEAIAAIKPF